MNQQRVLILRPEPGASATAVRAAALGLAPVVCPLFSVAPFAWNAPGSEQFDAVMMTSAQAALLGGDGLAPYLHLPLYAIGAATAAAARVAGFADVRIGGGNSTSAELVKVIATRGHRKLLHLAGMHHRNTSHAALEITHRVVYSATVIQPAPVLPDAPIVLAHSSRSAERFAQCIHWDDRIRRTIIAISSAAADSAGVGWASVQIADAPNDAAMLARAVEACMAQTEMSRP